MLKSLPARKGASIRVRLSGLGAIMSLVSQTAEEQYWKRNDPLGKLRRQLKSERSELKKVEEEVEEEIRFSVEEALSS